MSLEHNHGTEIELNERSPHPVLSAESEQQVYPVLKPTDGGRHAWQALIAAFFFEALLWGFPVCFGVFQEYYSHGPFMGQNVAIIGTIAQGTCYIGAPISMALTKKYQKFQRSMICAGWMCCILALGLGSLAKNLGTLVITQGVMYGLGFLMLYWVIMNIIHEFWIVRKGFAFGLIMSAAGASGAVLPFVFQALLDRFGFRVTLQATAITMIILTGPLIPFCKGRLPPSEQSVLANLDWSFRSSGLFWTYMLSTGFQGFGLFAPALFLASYATDVSFSARIGALLLSAQALAQFAGLCVFGTISDKRWMPVSMLAMICSTVSSFAAFLLWGFGHSSLPILMVFSMVFGFFGYGFSSMRAAMAASVTNDPTTLIALQATLIASQGLGNILVGPISASLIHGGVNRGSYAAGKYQSLVYFTGSCMLGSAAVLMIPTLRHIKLRAW